HCRLSSHAAVRHAAARNPVPQTVSDPVSQTVSDPVSQTVSDPISQTVSDPISQTVSDPVSQTVSDPLSQTVSDPVSQTVSAPISQTVSDPVSQTVSDPRLADRLRHPLVDGSHSPTVCDHPGACTTRPPGSPGAARRAEAAAAAARVPRPSTGSSTRHGTPPAARRQSDRARGTAGGARASHLPHRARELDNSTTGTRAVRRPCWRATGSVPRTGDT